MVEARDGSDLEAVFGEDELRATVVERHPDFAVFQEDSAAWTTSKKGVHVGGVCEASVVAPNVRPVVRRETGAGSGEQVGERRRWRIAVFPGEPDSGAAFGRLGIRGQGALELEAGKWAGEAEAGGAQRIQTGEAAAAHAGGAVGKGCAEHAAQGERPGARARGGNAPSAPPVLERQDRTEIDGIPTRRGGRWGRWARLGPQRRAAWAALRARRGTGSRISGLWFWSFPKGQRACPRSRGVRRSSHRLRTAFALT